MGRSPSRSLLSLLSVLSVVVPIGGLAAVTRRTAGSTATASRVATRPIAGRGLEAPGAAGAYPVHVDTAAAGAQAASPAAPPPPPPPSGPGGGSGQSGGSTGQCNIGTFNCQL